MSDEPISRAAFERLRTDLEEAEARAQAAEARYSELENLVRDFHTRENVLDYLEDQGVEDPRRWANVVLPHLSGVHDPDELHQRLEQLLPDLDKLRPSAAAFTPAQPIDEDGEPILPPETTMPMGLDTGDDAALQAARDATSPQAPMGNPAGAGVPIRPQALSIFRNHDQVSSIIETRGMAGLRAAVRRGEIYLSPEVRERHGL